MDQREERSEAREALEGAVPRRGPSIRRAPGDEAKRARRLRGSAVTWAVTIVMIVALAVYLAVAFFAADSGDSPSSPEAPAAEESR